MNHAADLAAARTAFAGRGLCARGLPGLSGVHLKADLTAAIRTFQRRHGLGVDGVITPSGPTARALGGVIDDAPTLPCAAKADYDEAECVGLGAAVGNAQRGVDTAFAKLEEAIAMRNAIPDRSARERNALVLQLSTLGLGKLIGLIRRIGRLIDALRDLASERDDLASALLQSEVVFRLEDEYQSVLRKEEAAREYLKSEQAKLDRAVSRFQRAGCPSRLAPDQWVA